MSHLDAILTEWPLGNNLINGNEVPRVSIRNKDPKSPELWGVVRHLLGLAVDTQAFAP